jgi:mannosyltransferase OCH1-like enzyme
MAIPKTIYQTYKTTKLPIIFRWHIRRLRKNNPSYTYEFYDDKRASDFITEAYGNEISALFNRINIGAAKADFFRYAILYKKGGVYLDIDSLITSKIDDFIKPEDVAVISNESNLNFFLQYVLFFEPQHPILKRTMDLMISNLRQNTYPYDTHKMTGPTVFTKAINDCMT